MLAQDFVVLKPGFHTAVGTNVVISIGSSASNQPQNSMLLTNNKPKVEEPYLQSLLINNTDYFQYGSTAKPRQGNVFCGYDSQRWGGAYAEDGGAVELRVES